MIKIVGEIVESIPRQKLFCGKHRIFQNYQNNF